MISKPYKNAKLSDITNPYGGNPQWYGGIPHQGTDWVSSYGTPLVAPEDCVIDNIITSENISPDLAPISRGYGIIMKGVSGKFHLYWHCQPVFPVELGQSIKQGEVVAFMGNSGFTMVGGIPVPYDIRPQKPYLGTHVHQETFTFDIYSQRIYEDPVKIMDMSIPINYDLLTSIGVVLRKIINLLLKK